MFNQWQNSKLFQIWLNSERIADNTALKPYPIPKKDNIKKPVELSTTKKILKMNDLKFNIKHGIGNISEQELEYNNLLRSL